MSSGSVSCFSPTAGSFGVSAQIGARVPRGFRFSLRDVGACFYSQKIEPFWRPQKTLSMRPNKTRGPKSCALARLGQLLGVLSRLLGIAETMADGFFLLALPRTVDLHLVFPPETKKPSI